MSGWKNLIELKMTDETTVYDTKGMTFGAFYREHFDRNGFGEWIHTNLTERIKQSRELLDKLMKLSEVEQWKELKGERIPDNVMIVDEIGNLKNIETELVKENAAKVMAAKMHEANMILQQLMHLGLEDDTTIIGKDKATPADVLQMALEKNLVLHPQDKDLVVMVHEIGYFIGKDLKNIRSVLAVKGSDSIHTAMAKTVGLPLGIAASLILQDKIPLRGVHIPTRKEIYAPVLAVLREKGIHFTETTH